MLKFRVILRRAWMCAPLVLGVVPYSVAQASSVAIDTLSVSSLTFNIALTGGAVYNFSGPVSPPVDVTMGIYQDPIVAGTGWKIYSTSTAGPAPTGTVDSALGTINVDFSSLRGQFISTYGMLDFALWPLTTAPSSSSYTGGTGAYTLNWSDNFSISLTGLPPITGVATVSLGGSVTPVPLPAAVWLLGSGLLGIAAATRRKRSA